MKRRAALFSLLISLVLIGALVGPTGAGAATRTARLQMYEAVVDAATAEQLTNEGYDVVTAEQVAGGVRVIIVMYPFEKTGLTRQGIDLELWRNDAGLTATQLSARQTSAGFKVWRDYDGPDGLRQYMYDLEETNEDILDLEVVGHTYGHDADGPVAPREIIALRLTANEEDSADGDKPAALYSSLIHAREWITGEVNRRLLEWFIKGWREGKPAVTQILQTTELWFVLVQNPDGYQYTFDLDRLWRKNLADNDEDGDISVLDGVDLNRNFPEHWKFDDEGSASIFTDQTYRGPSAASEPETAAIMEVFERVHPTYHITWHSFGYLLLYTFGFQVNTPSADDPIYVAWAGTDKKPAVTDTTPASARTCTRPTASRRTTATRWRTRCR